MAVDKYLYEKDPKGDSRVRLRNAIDISYKTVGRPEQRAIRAMKLQRNPNLKPEDLDYEPEPASDFDQEHDAAISEAVDQLRKGRAGIPLEEFKRRRPGTNDT